MRESEKRQVQNRISDVVRGVRWRWRMRLALRGLMWVVALTAGVTFLAAIGLERARFDADTVIALRVLTWFTLLASTMWFLVRPLRRKVTDAQVALYLEEHEPSLEHSLTSVLDEGSGSASPDLTHRVTEIALEKAHSVRYGRRIEQGGFYRFAGGLTALVVLALSVTLLGPAHLRLGLSALLFPTTAAEAVNPYSVGVLPGDVTIARGSDQMVTATLGGFEAGEASIFTRSESGQSFQRLSMLTDLDGGFEVLLLGVNEPTEYFVESTGVRSGTFMIDVADLPYVDQIDLTLFFPGYTGLQSRVIEAGGDVAALPGTVVELNIQPTMLTDAGQLLLDGNVMSDLTVEADGTLTGRFTVGEGSFYSLELARSDNGEMVPASPEYRIDVLSDMDPSIRFSTPGRDMPASSIEEVYLEMVADDDYGIGTIDLVYSVNGLTEDTVSVFQGRGAPLPEVSTGHTFFLEEWELEVGDLVSYYAMVRDNRGRASRTVTSDIYFLNIRPFERAYRQAEQQGGGGGGGGGGAETALSETQRQIIAATFNLMRQRDTYSDEEFSENVVSVSLAQARLQDQVTTLLQRMQNRGLTQSDEGFRDVSAILPQAFEAMTRAVEDLNAEELQEAMPDEQEALRFLQQAEETYERYVQQQQQGGGGGGGGGQQAADDLADLFELELDKLKNQYETVQRGEQQQADNQVDELLEELQELARRQEQVAERQRRASANQSAQGSGGEAQRELADQTEEAARQLQRLAREMNDPSLEESARDLQQAAEAMRQSAAAGGSQAMSESNSALRGLEDARRQLENARSERARRDAEEAIDEVEELQRQQRDVQRAVRELPRERGPERQAEIDRLRERKDQMHEVVQDLERRLDEASRSAGRDNAQAARELGEAADEIRESKLKEKLQYTRGTIEQWDPESAVTMELQIEGDLQVLRDRLEAARGATGERVAEPLEDALGETRDLVRGMEAMERRLSESGEQQGQNDQPGQGEGQGEGEGEGQQGNANRLGGGGANDGWVGDRSASSPFGGAARGTPREFSQDEIRQFQSEFRQRESQLMELREDLQNAGRPVEELRELIQSFQDLQRDEIYGDPAALTDLSEEMVDQLKRLEFSLRREVEGEADRRATLNGADEVPDGYRRLVEEYYRSLARRGSGPGGN